MMRNSACIKAAAALICLLGLVLLSSCKVRENEDPLLPTDFGTSPSHTTISKLDQELGIQETSKSKEKSAPASKADQTPKALKPGDKTQKAKVKTPPPAPEAKPTKEKPAATGLNLEKLAAAGSSLLVTTSAGKGLTATACPLLGSLLLCSSETSTVTGSDKTQKPASLGLLPDSGIHLYRIPTKQEKGVKAKLRKQALALGEELALVTMAGKRKLAVSARVAALPILPAAKDKFKGPDRFFLLDRPFHGKMAGALVLDSEGSIAGVVTGREVSGMLAALSVQELALIMSPGESYKKRYEWPEVKKTDKDLPAIASRKLQLGMQVQTLTPELSLSMGLGKEQTGVLVTRIYPEKPAAKAGLQAGDLIVSLGGSSVRSLQDLPAIMSKVTMPQAMPIAILRETQPLVMQITPQPRPVEGK